MDDLISRQAVIEAMEDVDWYHINKDGQLTHGANSKEDEPLYKAEDIYNVLEQLPSAQPEDICSECDAWNVYKNYAQPELPEWAQKVEEYRKSAPSFVRNQLVWALYQTWKEYDGRLVHQRGKENR